MDNDDGAKQCEIKVQACSSLRGHFPSSLFIAKLGVWAGLLTRVCPLGETDLTCDNE